MKALSKLPPLKGSDREFAIALALAFALHIIAYAAWMIYPHMPVANIPVRVLNLKLGEGEDVASAATPAPLTEEMSPLMQSQAVPLAEPARKGMDAAQKELEDLLQQKERATPLPSVKPTSALPQTDPADSNAAPNEIEHLARQFVRERTVSTQSSTAEGAKGTGSALGNTTEGQAEILKRYEQLISAWIQRFKVYPEVARMQNMQGEGVLRIRIDRQGNIRYSIVDKSAGYQVLDRAIADMAKRANPVPPVPENYKASEQLLEFLVPISFKLNER